MKLICNYQIIGKENLNDWKPCIIAANHISYNDPPFIGAILGHEVHYLAKRELFKNKFYGKVLSFFNSIPVNRGIVDREALKNVINIINKGQSIMLFPEGSRKSSSAKPGIGLIIYETGVPILPVKIENSNRTKECLLRKKRVHIFIGKMIETKHYQQYPAEKNTYQMIANDVLSTINTLSDGNIDK